LERGDVLAAESTNIGTSDHFEARVVWLHPDSGHPGRRVDFRLGHSNTRGTITRAWGLDENHVSKAGETRTIRENSISQVTIELSQAIPFAPFVELPELGRFVLVDSTTGETLAAGTLLHALRRAENVVVHDFSLETKDFEDLTGVRGRVAWFTGLSGSGKSTLANKVSEGLHELKIPHAILDGDTLRKGLTKDLGFSEADRIENIRRIAEVAKLMADSGLVVLVSLISPYRSDRENAASIIGSDRFIEVFVDTPLEICEQRDPKGLYKKARAGDLPHFTGVSAPYERPNDPEISIDGQQPVGISSQIVLERLFGES
jgi:bifunctional enzyme CysN/CysC